MGRVDGRLSALGNLENGWNGDGIRREMDRSLCVDIQEQMTNEEVTEVSFFGWVDYVL